MTVVAVMSTKDGKPVLDGIVRPGPFGVEVDGSEATVAFLADLNVVAGNPPEPMSMSDGDDWIQALPWNLTGTYSWAEFVSHGQRGEPLVPSDLEHRLDLFEADLRRHGLAENTVRTYEMHANRMVKWLVEAPERLRGSLDDALRQYKADVESRDLAPLTTQTYLYGPTVFIRWLQGLYVPGSTGPTVGDDAREDDSWLSEPETQARLVRWLEQQGWEIVGQAVGHQHGVDVTASKDGQLLAIEVKGHPQSKLVAGERKGQARHFHPAAQARTYYANALHAVLATMDKHPDQLHAIALPTLDRYRSMVENTRRSLSQLGVGVFLVPKEGAVETMLKPHQPGKSSESRE
jgi:hypothetical protein